MQQWWSITHGDPQHTDHFSDHAAAVLAERDDMGIEVESLEIPAGLYARHTLMGPYTQINASLGALYASWLPCSGYEPDDRPTLEHYLNSPRTGAASDLRTELLIPLRPLHPL